MPSPFSWLSSVFGHLQEARSSRVVGKQAIANLLSRVCHEEPLISVTLARSSTQYTSSLLKVSEDGGVWLDKLSPAEPGSVLSLHSKVKVRGHLEGGSLHFNAPVVELGIDKGIGCYRLGLPKVVKYRQRRTAARVRAMGPSPITVYVVDSAAKLLQAELLDISIGGIAASTSSGDGLSLKRGDQLPSCTVRLPLSPLQCALEVRHVCQARDGDAWIFGGCFVDLGDRHRDTLEQFIIDVQAA